MGVVRCRNSILRFRQAESQSKASGRMPSMDAVALRISTSRPNSQRYYPILSPTVAYGKSLSPTR